jgi:hypothetical protein
MNYEFTATILSLKRLNSSVNGNPAYLVTFDNGGRIVDVRVHKG